MEILLNVATRMGKKSAFGAVRQRNDEFCSFWPYYPISSFEDWASVGFAIMGDPMFHHIGNIFAHRSIYEKIGQFAPLATQYAWDFMTRMLALEEGWYSPDALYICEGKVGGDDLHSFETMAVYARYFQILNSGNFKNSMYPVYQTLRNAGNMWQAKMALGNERLDAQRLLEWLQI